MGEEAGDRPGESTNKVTPTGVSFYRLGWITQEGLRSADPRKRSCISDKNKWIDYATSN